MLPDAVQSDSKDQTLHDRRKSPKDNFSQDEPIYDIKVNRKTACSGRWSVCNRYIEMTQMKGNLFRYQGVTVKGKEMLFPEEALYSVEKASMYVHRGEDLLAKIKSSIFFQDVMNLIPQECYLAYSRLRSLEYIVRRHSLNADHNMYAFKSELDAYHYLKEHRDRSILDSMVSFDVYACRQGWSKRNVADGKGPPPDAFVVVVSQDHTLSARLMLTLLKQSKGIPIMVAAIMPTGHMMLQEFTDASISLNWENTVAPRDFWLPDLPEPEIEEGEDKEEAIEEINGNIKDNETNIDTKTKQFIDKQKDDEEVSPVPFTSIKTTTGISDERSSRSRSNSAADTDAEPVLKRSSRSRSNSVASEAVSKTIGEKRGRSLEPVVEEDEIVDEDIAEDAETDLVPVVLTESQVMTRTGATRSARTSVKTKATRASKSPAMVKAKTPVTKSTRTRSKGTEQVEEEEKGEDDEDVVVKSKTSIKRTSKVSATPTVTATIRRSSRIRSRS